MAFVILGFALTTAGMCIGFYVGRFVESRQAEKAIKELRQFHQLYGSGGNNK